MHTHYMTPAAHAAILEANRVHRERLRQMRNARTLLSYLQQQGQPVRNVPAVHVPFLLSGVCK